MIKKYPYLFIISISALILLGITNIHCEELTNPYVDPNTVSTLVTTVNGKLDNQPGVVVSTHAPTLATKADVLASSTTIVNNIKVSTETLATVDTTNATNVRVATTTIAVMASTAAAKADENSNLIAQNWYTTSTISAVFLSTDTSGDLQVSTVTYYLGSDYTIIGWSMNGDVSDTATVFITSSGFNTPASNICGTDLPDLVTQAKSSDGALSGWFTNLGAGGWVNFVLAKAVAARKITVALTVKKWTK